MGGGDFTFLPYPEQIIYNGENDNPLQETPTGNYYKSSHPIISGISKDSVYVKDLEMLNQKSPSIFSEKEGAELRQLKKSLNNTTDGNNDELGKYIGNTDFSQVYIISVLLKRQNQDFSFFLESSIWGPYGPYTGRHSKKY